VINANKDIQRSLTPNVEHRSYSQFDVRVAGGASTNHSVAVNIVKADLIEKPQRKKI